MRHGEAEKSAARDADRKLTTRGMDQIRSVCDFAKSLGAFPDTIVASPLARAMASAEIARTTLNPSAKILVDDCLEPEGDTQELFRYLSLLKGTKAVLLATHMPLMGRIVADMTGCSRLELKPGCLARIDCADSPALDSGTLVWLLPPH
jgi:phosphohistidine phosphatase SixA